MADEEGGFPRDFGGARQCLTPNRIKDSAGLAVRERCGIRAGATCRGCCARLTSDGIFPLSFWKRFQKLGDAEVITEETAR